MAMTLRLTPDETQALRDFADTQDRSMQAIAREAVMSHINQETRQQALEPAATDLLARYPDTLRRLGQ